MDENRKEELLDLARDELKQAESLLDQVREFREQAEVHIRNAQVLNDEIAYG